MCARTYSVKCTRYVIALVVWWTLFGTSQLAVILTTYFEYQYTAPYQLRTETALLRILIRKGRKQKQQINVVAILDRLDCQASASSSECLRLKVVLQWIRPWQDAVDLTSNQTCSHLRLEYPRLRVLGRGANAPLRVGKHASKNGRHAKNHQPASCDETVMSPVLSRLATVYEF
jgi:hypothetical protein